MNIEYFGQDLGTCLIIIMTIIIFGIILLGKQGEGGDR